MLCSEALDLFLRSQEINGSTSKTIKHYKTHIQYFINFVGDIDVNTVNYRMYEDYILYLKSKYKGSQVSQGEKKKLSGRTVKTYASALKTFLSYCYNVLNIIDYDISAKIKMPKYQKKVITILNENQINEILNYYDTDTYLGCRNLLAICLMLDCGLRVSEVANLCFSDFDVYIRCIRINGKGQKQRYVPFTDFVFVLYNKLLTLNKNCFKYPFCDNLGNKLTTNGIIQIVKRLKKRAWL